MNLEALISEVEWTLQLHIWNKNETPNLTIATPQKQQEMEDIETLTLAEEPGKERDLGGGKASSRGAFGQWPHLSPAICHLNLFYIPSLPLNRFFHTIFHIIYGLIFIKHFTKFN